MQIIVNILLYFVLPWALIGLIAALRHEYKEVKHEKRHFSWSVIIVSLIFGPITWALINRRGAIWAARKHQWG